jgi:hypothetical protein
MMRQVVELVDGDANHGAAMSLSKPKNALTVRQLKAVPVEFVTVDRVLTSYIINDCFFDQFAAFDADV